MRMETILAIEENDTDRIGDEYSGYVITTDKQKISLLIDNYQQCCENVGYFLSDDDIRSFIGSKLLGIKITDTELKEGLLKKNELDEEFFEGGIMFVDIETSKGTLQFVAYNEHNGYYGHEAKVISEQLKHNEYL